MMYNFNGNYINAAKIVSLACTTVNDQTHPYLLTVKLDDGQSFGVRYTKKIDRDGEASRIARFHDNTCPDPVSRWQMEAAIGQAVEKVRRDLRVIKKIVMEGQSHE